MASFLPKQEQAFKDLETRCANALNSIAKLTYENSSLEQQSSDLRKQLSEVNDVIKKAPTENIVLLESFRSEALEHRQTIEPLEGERLQLSRETIEKRVAEETLARKSARKQAADFEKEIVELREKLSSANSYMHGRKTHCEADMPPAATIQRDTKACEFKKVDYQSYGKGHNEEPAINPALYESDGLIHSMSPRESPAFEDSYSTLRAGFEHEENKYQKLHQESIAAMAVETDNIRKLSLSVAARDRETFDKCEDPDWHNMFKVAHDSYEENIRILEKAFAQTSRAYNEAQAANQTRFHEQCAEVAGLETKLHNSEAMIKLLETDRYEMASGSKTFQLEQEIKVLKGSLATSVAAVKETLNEKEYWYSSFYELETKRNISPDDGDVEMDDACVDDRIMDFRTASQLIDELKRIRSENGVLAIQLEEKRLAVLHSSNETQDLAFQHQAAMEQIRTMRDKLNIFEGRTNYFQEIKDLEEALAKVKIELVKCREDNNTWSRQYNEEVLRARQLQDEISALQVERRELRKDVPWDRRTSMAEDFLQ